MHDYYQTKIVASLIQPNINVSCPNFKLYINKTFEHMLTIWIILIYFDLTEGSPRPDTNWLFWKDFASVGKLFKLTASEH